MIRTRYARVCLLTFTTLVVGCASKPETKKADNVPMDVPRNPRLHAYVDALRQDVAQGKVEIINSIMNLKPDESAVFWPIYNEYEKEVFALNDRRVDVVHAFAKKNASGQMTNADADALANEYFAYNAKRLELVKKYQQTIAKSLSPVRAAQFTQIEHRVNTIIDLAIAAEVPLIRTKAE